MDGFFIYTPKTYKMLEQSQKLIDSTSASFALYSTENLLQTFYSTLHTEMMHKLYQDKFKINLNDTDFNQSLVNLVMNEIAMSIDDSLYSYADEISDNINDEYFNKNAKDIDFSIQQQTLDKEYENLIKDFNKWDSSHPDGKLNAVVSSIVDISRQLIFPSVAAHMAKVNGYKFDSGICIDNDELQKRFLVKVI